MKVKELIKELVEYDPEADVRVSAHDKVVWAFSVYRDRERNVVIE